MNRAMRVLSQSLSNPAATLFLLPALVLAQGNGDLTAQGERVFNQTCATGYCHGVRGVAAGAPRLAARGFDRAFINTTVARGVSGTAMRAFAATLDRGDLNAVVAYVASLNGIADGASDTMSS